MSKQIKKITLNITKSKLENDLEGYRKLALELGASKALIIKAEDIPVDERVTLKCQVPRCFGYGVSANCPPNTLTPRELKRYLKKYRWGIFFTIDFPSAIIVRDKTTKKERIAAYQKVFKVVSEVESAAFYDGYYLAFGFAAGSCRHTLCWMEENCLALEGQKCRFSLRSRPSMEAVGIDVYKLVAQIGWDIYPIGSSAVAGDVPKGTLAGLIIVH